MKGLDAFAIVLGILLAALVVTGLIGFFIMLLWNAVIPDLLGLPPITFLQAWVLKILSVLLFYNQPSSSGKCGCK